jgi:hypothetical protein
MNLSITPLALAIAVLMFAGSTASAALPPMKLSYRAAVDCAGALGARVDLAGLTPDQYSDYMHDAQSAGLRMGLGVPRARRDAFFRDSAAARSRWGIAASKSTVQRRALERRADECRSMNVRSYP